MERTGAGFQATCWTNSARVMPTAMLQLLPEGHVVQLTWLAWGDAS